MSHLLNYLVFGLATGTTYALVGLGIALVYQVTGVINFAQGDFVMFGAVLFAVLTGDGWNLPLAGLLAIAATAAVGLLTNLLVIAPARRASHQQLIILTIGASIVIQVGTIMAFGPESRNAPEFSSGGAIELAGVMVKRQYLWCAGITALAVLAMWLFLTRTPAGIAMRATAMDRNASRLMGISPSRMGMLAFTLAAGLGALGGVLLASIQQANPGGGLQLGLMGFAAAVLGGLDSPAGAVAGGLAFGVVEALVLGYLDTPGYHLVVNFGLLFLVLLIRPTGLLRRAQVVRV